MSSLLVNLIQILLAVMAKLNMERDKIRDKLYGIFKDYKVKYANNNIQIE